MRLHLIEPRTYHLIRQSASRVRACVDWYQKVRVDDGKEVRQGWMHWLSGGGYTDFIEYEILRTTVLSEGVCDFDLDLTGTTTHAQLCKDEQELTDKGACVGWLSPEGVMRRCAYHCHDDYATYILKKHLSDLRREGWMRVHIDGFSSDRPTTEAQAQWLLHQREKHR